MSPSPSTSTLTMEFGHELEQERHAWLRRRFMWYCGVMLGFTLIERVGSLFSKFHAPIGLHVVQWTLTMVALVTYAAAYRYIARSQRPHIPPLKLASAIVLGLGLFSLVISPFMAYYTNQAMQEQAARTSSDGRTRLNPVPGVEIDLGNGPKNNQETPQAPDIASDVEDESSSQATPSEPSREPMAQASETDEGTSKARLTRAEKLQEVSTVVFNGFLGLWTIFASHFIACVFLPWTGRESLKPIIPLLLVNAVMTAVFAIYNASVARQAALMPIMWLALGFLGLSLLTPMPGLAVCAWRHRRFHKRATFDVLRDRYSALKHELTSARQIHESLFPTAIQTGECLFRYEYEPMRQIGGDYLHVFAGPANGPGERALSLILVDVTGHGIPAALTVNRLHGELARIFAENPSVPPGEVLRLLNSYVHLTLATHSVYVTAICLRACAKTDTLEYASGGHPPAFLRSVDGTIERLDSTAFVLGVSAGPDFQPEPRTVRFGPGDTLVAYTDGATEARDDHGRYFGIEGIQRVLAVGRADDVRGWPGTLRDAVEGYREGPTMDDVLVIEMHRPLARVVEA